MAHTLTPILVTAPAGDYIALKSTGFAVRGGKHERGQVQGFSFRSRSRLMAKISQLRKHHMPLFVTLTYPDQYPVEWEEFKADLHRFMVALTKKYPKAGLIWKLEFQKRGAAHYHCMVWGVELEVAQDYIPKLWHKIAGHKDENHLLFHQGKLAGSRQCVEAVRSWHGVKSYASKYLAKLDERTERTGRFWGVVGKVPFSPLVSFVIDIKTALEFRRAMAKRTGMKFKRFGFWSNDMNADWLRFLEYWENEVGKIDIPPLRFEIIASRFGHDLAFSMEWASVNDVPEFEVVPEVEKSVNVPVDVSGMETVSGWIKLSDYLRGEF